MSASGRSLGCAGCYADLYEFTLTVPTPPASPLVVLMQSSSLNAYLRLLDSTGAVIATDDNSGGTNALIRRDLGPGTYRIEATTPQSGIGGSYFLTVRIAQLSIGSINVSQSLNGTLTQFTGTSSRCTYCYADYYDLQLSAAQIVSITLSSSSFDSYLRLFDRNLNMLASDDNGGGGTNSRISATLQAGSYRVEV